MTLRLHYSGQLSLACERSDETLEIENGATVGEVVHLLAQKHGKSFQKFVLNNAGDVESTLFLALDGEQVTDLSLPIQADHRELMLMPPIAGG